MCLAGRRVRDCSEGYLAFACRALVEQPCLCPFASRLWISGLVGKVVSFVLCLAFDRLGGRPKVACVEK